MIKFPARLSVFEQTASKLIDFLDIVLYPDFCAGFCHMTLDWSGKNGKSLVLQKKGLILKSSSKQNLLIILFIFLLIVGAVVIGKGGIAGLVVAALGVYMAYQIGKTALETKRKKKRKPKN